MQEQAATEEPSEEYELWERILLVTYYITCTILTIGFNSFTLFTIVKKVDLRKSISCIPVLCSSVLGLIYGVGVTFFQGLAIILGYWPGAFFWCVTANNIYTYVVYATIYCATAQIVEVAYRVSHPLTYDKTGRRAYYGMWAATILALLVNLPNYILQYTVLQPTDWVETFAEQFNHTITKAWTEYYEYNDPFPYNRGKDHASKNCARNWFPGSFDFNYFVNWILVVNLTAVTLVVASSLVIAATLRRSNKKLGLRHAKQAKLNCRVAKSSVLMTTITLLPWLPNLIYSLVSRARTKSEETKINNVVSDICFNLYFSVPWVFALINMRRCAQQRRSIRLTK